MRLILTVSFIAVSVAFSFAQRIYFPKANYKDSTALVKSIVGLAKSVIPLYHDDNKVEYFDNLFRYQIVAHEYLSAKKSIDSLRRLTVPVRAIQHESYLSTKEIQKTDSRPFDEIYKEVLTRLLDNLSEQDKSTIGNNFSYPLSELKNELGEILKKITVIDKDSIEFTDAQALCRKYNGYNVYSNIKEPSRKVLKAEEQKRYIIKDSVLITTREGSILTAVIVRSKIDSVPKPVVMLYNIYASLHNRDQAKKAVAHGFIGVVVNTRGKYLSPQDVKPFEHDASDAYDVLDWISKQPWCNGKIGMYGGSYVGFSQWSAVKNIHPALKTIVPQASVGAGIDYPIFNNVFMTYMLQWIHLVTNTKLTDEEEFSNVEKWNNINKAWYLSGKSFRSLDSLEGRPNAIFHQWLKHPSFDDFWCNMAPCREEFGKINIPVLTTTGYYDDDQRGALYYFDQHHKYNKNAEHYLLIGPYDHGGAQGHIQPHLRGYTIDSIANINLTEHVFQWFNYILKDGAKPPILKDKINYQVMGSNTWQHAPSLREMNTDTLQFYLSNIRSKNVYELQSLRPKTKDYVLQEMDYGDRNDIDKFMAFDEFSILDTIMGHGNFLDFMSQSLESSLIINGSFTGEIDLIINKKDIDLAVELIELQPNGKYFVLSNYLTRASYTKNRKERKLLRPGKKETILINNSYFVSKRLERGSRIIVRVGVNKSPYWQINYGTGKDVSDETIQDGRIPLRIEWLNTSVIKIPVSK